MNDPADGGLVRRKRIPSRFLLIALIFFIILSLLLLIGLIMILSRKPNDTCLSPECIKTGKDPRIFFQEFFFVLIYSALMKKFVSKIYKLNF